jgi:hypothetical protein
MHGAVQFSDKETLPLQWFESYQNETEFLG